MQRANLLSDKNKRKRNLNKGIGNYLELETYVVKANEISSKQSLKAILSLEEQIWKGDLLQQYNYYEIGKLIFELIPLRMMYFTKFVGDSYERFKKLSCIKWKTRKEKEFINN